jgi:hypothetical protein
VFTIRDYRKDGKEKKEEYFLLFGRRKNGEENMGE